MVKVVTALGILAALVIAVPAPAAQASAAQSSSGQCLVANQQYPPTETDISVKGDVKIKAGQRIKLTIGVMVNMKNEDLDQALGSPSGEVKVTISQKGNGVVSASTVTETFRFEGDPIVASFGPFAKGNYRVEAAFTPDDQSDWCSSVDQHEFEVVGAQGVIASTDGILPNTGGPSYWWLLFALLLMAGGAGAVTYARRRSAAA